MPDQDIYIATESGSVDIDGTPYHFHRGVTRVRKGHPLLKAASTFFEPVDAHVQYDVEQATAAPGEKRGEPVEAKKVPAKK